jgi:manganese transport protein
MCREFFPSEQTGSFISSQPSPQWLLPWQSFWEEFWAFTYCSAFPLNYALILTAFVTFVIAYLQKYGQRVVEVVITILVAVICASYVLELFLAKPDWQQVALHTLMPSLPNGQRCWWQPECWAPL